MAPHPASATWRFPPARSRDPRRVNLRELASDPARFEHHLVPIALAGDAQLELAMASEPLYFAHKNRSDEWALPLRTGDELLDAFPMRTFLSDETGRDVGRYKHGAGDLVLHPFGLAHWPGRLRPPYEPFRFAPGMRRRGLSVVLCGVRDLPAGRGPLHVAPGRAADVKDEGAGRMSLVDVHRDAPGIVATVGDATWTLLSNTQQAPDDGYLLVLDAAEPHFATDLVLVTRGEPLPNIRRALLLTSASGVSPPPDSWHAAPPPPFPPFEDSSPATHPLVTLLDDATVILAGHTVPRYWLARILFRLALHGPTIGWVSTYGGLTFDDRGDALQIGNTTVPRSDLEPLYRAVAPPGHTERT